jgi:hypothetical protein
MRQALGGRIEEGTLQRRHGLVMRSVPRAW